MKKKYSLTQNHTFNEVLKTGFKKNTNFFLLSKIPKKSEQKQLQFLSLGISVPKRYGNSVFRNKQKRQIKAIINDMIDEIGHQNYNVVILIREPFLLLDFSYKKEIITKNLREFLKTKNGK